MTSRHGGRCLQRRASKNGPSRRPHGEPPPGSAGTVRQRPPPPPTRYAGQRTRPTPCGVIRRAGLPPSHPGRHVAACRGGHGRIAGYALTLPIPPGAEPHMPQRRICRGRHPDRRFGVPSSAIADGWSTPATLFWPASSAIASRTRAGCMRGAGFPSPIVVGDRRPVAFVVGVHFEPHRIEDAKGAGKANAQQPREVPHRSPPSPARGR